MTSTWFGLEIAKRGTQVYRKAMDVTGHNITNANTPGYSRQEAVISPSTPWTRPDYLTAMTPGQLGTGADVKEVRRIRDYYLDVQMRNSGSFEGYWEKKLDMAKRTETVFLEPDGRGLQLTLLNFFNDWQNLNNSPQDPGVKKAVKETGDELATIFRQMHNQLSNIDKTVNSSLQYQVDQVNHLTTRIAELSNTIINVIGNGAQPNDLLDERDKLLDELAKFGHISVDTQDNGGIEVRFIETSGLLVKNDVNGKVITSKLSLVPYAGKDGNENHLAVDGKDVINLTTMADYFNTAPEGAGRGSILGQESARLENLSVSNKLDLLAKSIIDRVNEKSGLPGPAKITKPFSFFTGNGAADISLGDEIKNNPEVIIGENALAVAQLRSTPIRTLTGDEDVRNGRTFTDLSQTRFTVEGPGGNKQEIDLYLDGELALGYRNFGEIKAAMQKALDQKFGKGEFTVGDDGLGHIVLSANNGEGTLKVQATGSNIGLSYLFGQPKDAYVLDTTFENFFQGIVAQVGAAADHHDNMLENQQAIGQQIEALRQSVSGVSIDEELTKVIQYQYGYQACARMISMQDEMLDYLINRIR
ncbi:flagellar hook-associated protein FlgK [Desulforamulus reducens MI-1]|uniref:Flagellar hook-associated protein 1 n=1 Tax=Desulforamulus reducens (strain ATCC BAA-1160 / DSM 100696 / MI-1) TaxID=349161 RepID=A4J793_DESRM|nr:flagellar hook-associated protein FlgK [Desulforamulus reducens]ABO50946.1 flagellar hook-associated protein FlgK [Desulforamulus reducens MI-1]